MIVTEVEASTKRCQESFGPGPDTWETTPPNRLCIGSACMAWRARWRLLDADGKPFTEANYIYPPHDLAEGYTVQAVGYCGKAGRP